MDTIHPADQFSPAAPVALVLAGGSGNRSGSTRPKQLLDLHGWPVFLHVVSRHAELGHRIVVVASAETKGEIDNAIARHLPEISADVVVGGTTRRLSALAGLQAIPESTHEDTAIVVHNAASPNTPSALISACIDSLADHDAVQAFVPSEVTTIRRDGLEVIEMIPRASTGFNLDPTAYRRSLADEMGRTIAGAPDEGQTLLDIALSLGARVGLVESPTDNIKITLPGDLDILRASMRTTR